MPRTLLLSALAAAVIALDWLRLEEPRRGPVLLVVALAILPALAPRRWRPLALLGAAVLVGELALGLRHLPFRFASGFLDFYDYALPFASVEHHRMAGVVLIAVFGFAASCAQLLAARRPLGAAAVLVAGAGWPVTLLAGGDELLRGAVILAVALVLLAGRLSLRAVPVAAGVVLLAVAASAAPAVAKDAFLPWRTWDPYTRPQQPVGVSYVWDADYRGVRFPRKATTVLEIEAPQTAVYWSATTLDTFGRDHWIQTALPWTPLTGSVDFSGGSLVPARARRARLTRVHVTVRALRDSHLVGGDVPLAFASESAGGIQYAGDGKAVLTAVPIAGDSYTAVSDIERPEPQALARVGARYPVELVNAGFLRIAGYDVPAFGKRRSVTEIRRGLGPYAPLQARATEVARGAATPYAAALAIEEWLRSSGGFRYDEQPPQARGVPPLVGFVERTRAGYCQHFAGAMALMLRTLGIPARIAAGFTSGRYDRPAGRWIVTDRNAHAWVEVWFPGYGWLPFDPTPGRGHLDAPYSAASLSGDPVSVARLLRLARGGSSTQFENKLEG
ncbi:MAG: transglutaminase-like domain-containing protein, partial [Gaiellaceae bacterium]